MNAYEIQSALDSAVPAKSYPGINDDLSMVTVADSFNGLMVRRSLEGVMEAIRTGQILIYGSEQPQYFRGNIRYIRKPNLTKKQKQRAKKKLPVFTMGRFNGTRSNENTVFSIGLVLDFDNIGDERAIAKCKAKLKYELPYFRYIFRSPSYGVKAVILFDMKITNIFDYAKLYAHYAAEAERLTGYKVDFSACDISRLVFLSHDPDLLENQNAIPLPTSQILAELKPEIPQKVEVIKIEAQVNVSDLVDFRNDLGLLQQQVREFNQLCNTHLEKRKTIDLTQYEGWKGASNRERDLQLTIDIVNHLCSMEIQYLDWIKVGMALKSHFGVLGQPIWQLFANNPHYKDTDAQLSRIWKGFHAGSTKLGSLVYIGEKYGYQK